MFLAAHWAERWVPGSIGLLITGSALAWLLWQLVLGFASYRWPSAQGVITESRRVERVPSNRVRHVFARISYRYMVDGVQWTGDTVRFGHTIDANGGVARKLLAEFPVGREVTVRYNGKRSTLLPGPSGWLYIWTPLVAFVFGAILNELLTGS